MALSVSSPRRVFLSPFPWSVLLRVPSLLVFRCARPASHERRPKPIRRASQTGYEIQSSFPAPLSTSSPSRSRLLRAFILSPALPVRFWFPVRGCCAGGLGLPTRIIPTAVRGCFTGWTNFHGFPPPTGFSLYLPDDSSRLKFSFGRNTLTETYRIVDASRAISRCT